LEEGGQVVGYFYFVLGGTKAFGEFKRFASTSLVIVSGYRNERERLKMLYALIAAAVKAVQAEGISLIHCLLPADCMGGNMIRRWKPAWLTETDEWIELWVDAEDLHVFLVADAGAVYDNMEIA